MSDELVRKTVLGLGVLLGAGYIAAGLIGWIANAAEGSALAFWLLLLLGGGTLVLFGVFGLGARSTAAIIVAAIGAIAGALALWWSVIVPILALAFIALMVVRARRSAPAVAV